VRALFKKLRELERRGNVSLLSPKIYELLFTFNSSGVKGKVIHSLAKLHKHCETASTDRLALASLADTPRISDDF